MEICENQWFFYCKTSTLISSRKSSVGSYSSQTDRILLTSQNTVYKNNYKILFQCCLRISAAEINITLSNRYRLTRKVVHINFHENLAVHQDVSNNSYLRRTRTTCLVHNSLKMLVPNPDRSHSTF